MFPSSSSGQWAGGFPAAAAGPVSTGPAPQPAEKYSAIAEFDNVFGQGSSPLTGGAGVGGVSTGQAWNPHTSSAGQMSFSGGAATHSLGK